MGVQGLWSLLEPVGRRVNIEAISNKRLAVDASIWLFQFMKAMRDEKGEMMRNAHLLGFFRRICRLLFHRVRPIFVFDGATPALKRATHIARRRRREAQQAQLRKTAEKLLLNQLKKQALETAKAQRESQKGSAVSGMQGGDSQAVPPLAAAAGPSSNRQQQVDASDAGPGPSSRDHQAGPSTSTPDVGHDDVDMPGPSGLHVRDQATRDRLAADAAGAAARNPKRKAQVALDEALALELQRQMDAEDGGQGEADRAGPSNGNGVPGNAGAAAGVSIDDEAIAAVLMEELEAADAAAGIRGSNQREGGKKRQKKAARSGAYNEQEDDEELIASGLSRAEIGQMRLRARGATLADEEAARHQANDAILAEGHQRGEDDAHDGDGDDEDEDDDEDDGAGIAAALINQGALDLASLNPEVLATLPQSLQLDILEKMRDAAQAANREKFAAAAAAAPESFSSLQMATYLKASRFKQEIEGYKRVIGGAADADAGSGRRIASETGREFIFVRADGTSLTSKDYAAGGRGAGAGGFLGRGGKGRGRKQEVAPLVRAPPPLRLDSAKLAKFKIAAFKVAGSEGGQGEEQEEQLLASPLQPPLHLLQGLGKASAGGNAPAVPAPDMPAVMPVVKEDTKDEMMVEVKLDLGAAPMSDDELFGSSSGVSGLSGGGPYLKEGAAGSEVASRAWLTAGPGQQAGQQAGAPHTGTVLLPHLAPQLASGRVQQQTADEDDGVEWEDVGPNQVGGHRSSGDMNRSSGEFGGKGTQQQNWRDRMAARQKFWSTSHGFRMGRKLGDWGDGSEPAAVAAAVVGSVPGEPGRAASVERGPDGTQVDAEVVEEQDPELQEAIRQSLAVSGPSGPGHSAPQAAAHVLGHGYAAAAVPGPSQEQLAVADSDSGADVEWEEVGKDQEVVGRVIREPAPTMSLSELEGRGAIQAALQAANKPHSGARAAAGSKGGTQGLIQSINAHSQVRLEAPASGPGARLPPLPPPRLSAHANGPGKQTLQLAARTAPASLAPPQPANVPHEAAPSAAAPSFDFFSDAQPLLRKRTSPAPAQTKHAKHSAQPLLLQPKGQGRPSSASPEPGSSDLEETQLGAPGAPAAASNTAEPLSLSQPQPAGAEAGSDIEWEDLVAHTPAQKASAPSTTPAEPAPHAAASTVPAPQSVPSVPTPAPTTSATPGVAPALAPAPLASPGPPSSQPAASTPVKQGAGTPSLAALTTPGSGPSKGSTQLTSEELEDLMDEGEEDDWVDWAPPTQTGAGKQHQPSASPQAWDAQGKEQLQPPVAAGPDDALLSQLNEFETDIATQEEVEEEIALQHVNATPSAAVAGTSKRPPLQQQPSSQQAGSAQKPLGPSQTVQPANQTGLTEEDLWWAEEDDDEEGWVSWSPGMQQGASGAPRAAQPTAAEPPPMQAPEPPPLPAIDIDAALEEAEAEGEVLRREQRRAAVGAEGPTPEMYAECQELLQMFGLPFIVAPVEAEAQCAWLNAEGLVDGVVTDDNDVFLFGGRHVYRNIFDNKRYVEEYNMSDVERELGLNSARLAELALLLGSDYTEGVGGIGVVNAVEVVLAFPGEQGLAAFKAWVESPDGALLDAAKKAAGLGSQDEDSSQPLAEGETAAQREFKRAHRGARRNWQLPPSFPNRTVLSAYGVPHVDHNKKAFSWGRPDLELLRIFCRDRFGWATPKVDELLVPVLAAYDQRQTQLRIDQFLSFNQRFAKIKSKRLQKAVEGIAGRVDPDLVVAANTTQPSSQMEEAGPGSQPKDVSTGGSRAVVAGGAKVRRQGGGRKRKGAQEEGGEVVTEEGGEAGPGASRPPARKRDRPSKRAVAQAGVALGTEARPAAGEGATRADTFPVAVTEGAGTAVREEEVGVKKGKKKVKKVHSQS